MGRGMSKLLRLNTEVDFVGVGGACLKGSSVEGASPNPFSENCKVKIAMNFKKISRSTLFIKLDIPLRTTMSKV